MNSEELFNDILKKYLTFKKIENTNILLYLANNELYDYSERLLLIDSTPFKKYTLKQQIILSSIWANKIKNFSNISFLLDLIFSLRIRKSVKKSIFINLLLKLPHFHIKLLINRDYILNLYEIQNLLKYIKENDEKSNAKRNVEFFLIHYINFHKVSSKFFSVINSSIGNDKYISSEIKIFQGIKEEKQKFWVNHLMYGKNLEFYLHRLFDFNIQGNNYIAHKELNTDFFNFFKNIILEENSWENLTNYQIKKIIKNFENLINLFDIIDLKILINNLNKFLLKRNLEKNLIFSYNKIKERVTKI